MPRTLQTAIVVFFLATFGVSVPASAQTRLFSDDSEIQLTIEGPLGSLVRASRRNTDAVPAVVTVTVPGGAAERFDIQLSPRGFSRRTGGFCTFPPLRLDFAGDAVRGTEMRGQNKLKLVTRCRPGASYEQLNVLEYTAYRLYNEITPLSFRVRPARVTYRDTDRNRREDTQFNFLIEDDSDMARRNGRLVPLQVPTGEVRSSQLDPEATAVYTLFQYMIGNLDWDAVNGHPGDDCCHNSKFVAATAETRTNVRPVPYDFDFSGFVNAPYATPPEGIELPNIRTRLYRGYCRYNDQLPAAIALFQSRRAAILAVVDNETRLTDASRRYARGYLEGFFDIIDDPDRVQRALIDRCR
ncbi:MAG: hypothetical protein U1E03_00485 [Hyphomonadaceae bacterium]